MIDKHTPGPWIKDRNIIETESGEEIARISYERDGYAQANARLIASAPELLQALELIYDESRNPNIERLAGAAIKAAKGDA